MAMAYVYAAMALLSLVCGAATGRLGEVSAAAVEGAQAAVTLCLSLVGMMCLWTGVMEVLKRSGLAEKLAHLMRPLLKKLFPKGSRSESFLENMSANVSANLMGLGNAATPYGIAATKDLNSLPDTGDELCRLVVLNASSITLLPTTVASIRAGLGSQAPFDILPAVWITSVMSLLAGLLACKLMERRR